MKGEGNRLYEQELFFLGLERDNELYYVACLIHIELILVNKVYVGYDISMYSFIKSGSFYNVIISNTHKNV